MAVEKGNEDFVKVIFDVSDDTFGVGGEGVWAKAGKADKLDYRTTVSPAKG